MTPLINDPVELRNRGFEALVRALGWVNAVRFIQMYEAGQGDYTRERASFLPDWDAETLVRMAEEGGYLPRETWESRSVAGGWTA